MKGDTLYNELKEWLVDSIMNKVKFEIIQPGHGMESRSRPWISWGGYPITNGMDNGTGFTL
jgi:hypothetical protein